MVNRTKIALNAARFPLVSTKGSRAVFIPGLDSAPRTPRQFMGTESSADYNMAQVVYMENVMPVAEGLRSVGYQRVKTGLLVANFDEVLVIRDSKETVRFVVPADGNNYRSDPGSGGVWIASPMASIYGQPLSGSSPNNYSNAVKTRATVEGKSIICYSRLKVADGNDGSLIYWNETAGAFQPANFASVVKNLPFPAGEIDGVAASSGFLIVWSGLEVAWAPWNPDTSAFDFEIYANNEYTGAGVQIPADVKGQITMIQGVAGGFIIFTTRNAVAASFHNSALNAPWSFREVAGAGGVEGPEQVATDTNLGVLYANTRAGLQRISLNSAEAVLPEVSDFLASRQIERWIGSALQSTRLTVENNLYTKLAVLAERYLVISFGQFPQLYEYALVVDLALERWGRLKFDHVDAFGYVQTSPGVRTAQHMLAFLTAAGEIHLADWSYDQRASDTGLLVLGRIQLTRARNTQLNRVELEGAESCTVRILPSYDGRTLEAPVTPVVVDSSQDYLCVGTDLDCLNFDLVITGQFGLSTVIFEAVPSGSF